MSGIESYGPEPLAAGSTDASSFGFVIDEDDMTSDLDTKVPTQQSVKAYVDANAGGSSLVKAWVNFQGTGTVAITDDLNVSSITDNGTGDYTINFTSALADANYTVSGSHVNSEIYNGFSVHATNRTSAPTLKSTSAVRVRTATSSAQDVFQIYVNIIGN